MLTCTPSFRPQLEYGTIWMILLRIFITIETFKEHIQAVLGLKLNQTTVAII